MPFTPSSESKKGGTFSLPGEFMGMEGRLTRLLNSYASTRSSYALARLEFALKHPGLPSPPLIAPPAEGLLVTEQWDDVERCLDTLRRYLRGIDDNRGKRAAYDQSFAYLQRTYRELDQYARAVRWLITVDDRHASS
jgi:acyl carrier protein phosphodiesterase